MSTLEQIVRTVSAMYDDPQTTGENIVNVILAEKWNHNSDEVLTSADLTTEEGTWLGYWAVTNCHQYKRVAPMAGDMQEIFPGLLFGTALEFCVVYF